MQKDETTTTSITSNYQSIEQQWHELIKRSLIYTYHNAVIKQTNIRNYELSKFNNVFLKNKTIEILFDYCSSISWLLACSNNINIVLKKQKSFSFFYFYF